MATPFMMGLGFRVARERQCTDGSSTVRLFHFTLDDARANPALHLAPNLFAPKPRLGFSLAEQEVLEHALLGAPDDRIAELVGLSEDGLKKRWRAVFQRVAETEPELLPASVPVQSKRKLLLDALRMRLEEIRPYQAKKVPLRGK